LEQKVLHGCGADLADVGVWWEQTTTASVRVGPDGKVHVSVRDTSAEIGGTRCVACGGEVEDDGWEY